MDSVDDIWSYRTVNTLTMMAKKLPKNGQNKLFGEFPNNTRYRDQLLAKIAREFDSILFWTSKMNRAYFLYFSGKKWSNFNECELFSDNSQNVVFVCQNQNLSINSYNPLNGTIVPALALIENSYYKMYCNVNNKWTEQTININQL